MFGWALAFRSLVGIVVAALFAIPLHARMNAEERLLAETFAADCHRERSEAIQTKRPRLGGANNFFPKIGMLVRILFSACRRMRRRRKATAALAAPGDRRASIPGRRKSSGYETKAWRSD